MLPPKLVSHAGLTIDISQVLCLKYLSFYKGKTDILRIEFKKRYAGYYRNLMDEKEERLELNDFVDQEFQNAATAKKRKEEWEKIWNDYLHEYRGIIL